MNANTNTHGCHALSKRQRGAAFTLVELLVVISIIALLMGLLAPALASARGAARMSVSMSQMRQIAIAGQAWATERNGELVGAPGSSAKTLLNDPNAGNGGQAINARGDATQPFDWAGALTFGGFFGDVKYSKRRDDRFAMLNGVGQPDSLGGGTGAVSVLSNPGNRLISYPYLDSIRFNGIEGTAFQPQQAFSYLTAREFLWDGYHQSGYRPSWARAGFWGGPGTLTMTSAIAGDLALPGGNQGSGYLPRIERVGTNTSRKIFMAEGARFQAAGNDAIDHDVSVSGTFGGSFSDTGAWNVRFTRAWPFGFLSNGQEMIRNSFVHGGRKGEPKGNVCYYDTHVELQAANDIRAPELWVPSGSGVKLAAIWEDIRSRYEDLPQTGALAGFGFGYVTMP